MGKQFQKSDIVILSMNALIKMYKEVEQACYPRDTFLCTIHLNNYIMFNRFCRNKLFNLHKN